MFGAVHHLLMSLFNLQLGNFGPLPPSPEHSHSPFQFPHTLRRHAVHLMTLSAPYEITLGIRFTELLGQSLMDKDNSDTVVLSEFAVCAVSTMKHFPVF